MKKLLLTVAIGSATLLAQADYINGSIQLSGNMTVDSGSADTATKAVAWDSVVVNSLSGTFVTDGIMNQYDSVNLTAQIWSFTTATPITSFWQVDGYNFDLSSSAIQIQSGGYLSINLVGTVSGNGSLLTDMTGDLVISDPPVDGVATFMANLNFTGSPLSNSVPDNTSTMVTFAMGLVSLAGIGRLKAGKLGKSLSAQHERFASLKGLWQVGGKNRQKLTRVEQLEIHDARAMNLWLDLKIIALTIPVWFVHLWAVRGYPAHKSAPAAIH